MKRFLILLAALATGLATGGAGAPPDSCTPDACRLDALAPWFAKVAAARGGRGTRGTRPLHILQIGDSHTAGDVMTGGWRDLLRAKLGSGGRGVLAPGRPYDGYITHGVTASMPPGWSIAATFGRGSTPPRPPIGLASYSLTSTVEGARLGLSADDAADTFDRVVVCALRRSGAGGLTIDTGDGRPTHVDLNSMGTLGSATEPHCETVRTTTPRSSLSVTTDGGPVTVTSMATFNDAANGMGGGVVLSNVGVVGSQLVHFSRTDDAVVAEELRAYQPDLIVIAFGTNEGFRPRFDAQGYAYVIDEQVTRLRRLMGRDVPILMLAPPDALSQQGVLRTNADGPATGCAGGVLFAPPALAEVRRIQRAAAERLGVAWWDWGARMGGACSAQGWVARDLMRRDYVHFRSAGGRMVAQRLQDDLDAAAAGVAR